MKRRTTSHGLRVTVRQGGDVVDQHTYWRWDPTGAILAAAGSGVLVWMLASRLAALQELGTGVVVGATAAVTLPIVAAAVVRRWRSHSGALDRGSIPTASGGALADFVFAGPDAVSLRGRDAEVPSGVVRPGEPWTWRGPHAIVVDLDVIPVQHAPRWAGTREPPSFFVMVLMIVLGLQQLRFIQDLFRAEGVTTETYAEPTPEYIARLLQREFDGADSGMEERVVRAEQPQGNQSFYMPSGNAGPSTRTGGGAEMGDRTQRVENPEEDVDAALADVTEPERDDHRLEGELPQPERIEPDLPPDPEELLGEVPPDDEAPSLDELAAPTAMERFVGWGFRDWMEVRDARPEAERVLRRQLERVRQRLRIDPNDPGALNVLGYYAYLSENSELSRETYQRYVDLYPDDPIGYNNLALTYKRTGEYEQEEALYRKALAMAPLDTHVLNNLAVNLAHQGRYDEAMEVMDLLGEIMPGDPYADLHRAKIYATMGKRKKALRHLETALANVGELDTLHHIEFRQDIRIDPAFAPLRDQARFKRLLEGQYGDDARYLSTGPDGRFGGSVPHG